MNYCDDSMKAVINLNSIKHNINLIKNKLGNNTRFAAVVKADAYGHGAVPVSKAAIEAGADCLAVATNTEGAELREAGVDVPILVLSRGGMFDFSVDYNLTNCIFDYDSAVKLNETARIKNKVADIHLKINTGMARLGFNTDNQNDINQILKIRDLSNLRIKGVLSHYATADMIAEKEYVEFQSQKYNNMISDLNKVGINCGIKHICNSGGIFNYPGMHLDMVRAGIAMYGCHPDDSGEDYGLKPALELKSRIISVREIDKGESVSYGRRYIAESKRRVAIVAGGYADGINRLLSNKAYILICGKKAHILGTICMDVFMADITDIPEAKKGDEVILIGDSCSEKITADMIADMANTISYEILTSLSKRVEREYIGNTDKN